VTVKVVEADDAHRDLRLAVAVAVAVAIAVAIAVAVAVAIGVVGAIVTAAISRRAVGAGNRPSATREVERRRSRVRMWLCSRGPGSASTRAGRSVAQRDLKARRVG
jgi:hypothetical protein